MRPAFRHYLTKKRIRNILQVTRRRCYNVSGTAGTLSEEEFSTYQERLASYLQKMFQRIRNIWQVPRRRCYRASYLNKMLQRSRHVLHVTWTRYDNVIQRIRNVLEVTWRRCFNVSGTSCKWLDRDVRTHQDRLASCLTKTLRRIRNFLQVTSRRCYNVSGTSCKSLDEDVTT